MRPARLGAMRATPSRRALLSEGPFNLARRLPLPMERKKHPTTIGALEDRPDDSMLRATMVRLPAASSLPFPRHAESDRRFFHARQNPRRRADGFFSIAPDGIIACRSCPLIGRRPHCASRRHTFQRFLATTEPMSVAQATPLSCNHPRWDRVRRS